MQTCRVTYRRIQLLVPCNSYTQVLTKVPRQSITVVYICGITLLLCPEPPCAYTFCVYCSQTEDGLEV